MSDDNVVNFKKDGTRELLETVIQAYDDGLISSVCVVAQGYDETRQQKVLMPMVSSETSISQACIAAQVLNVYAGGAIGYTLQYGTRVDG